MCSDLVIMGKRTPLFPIMTASLHIIPYLNASLKTNEYFQLLDNQSTEKTYSKVRLVHKAYWFLILILLAMEIRSHQALSVALSY